MKCNSSRLRLLTPDVESKVRIAVILTTLLLGPLDVGNRFIAREGILEMLLVMANTEEVMQQKVRRKLREGDLLFFFFFFNFV